MLIIRLNQKTHIYQEQDFINKLILKLIYLLIIFSLHTFKNNFKISFEI